VPEARRAPTGPRAHRPGRRRRPRADARRSHAAPTLKPSSAASSRALRRVATTAVRRSATTASRAVSSSASTTVAARARVSASGRTPRPPSTAATAGSSGSPGTCALPGTGTGVSRSWSSWGAASGAPVAAKGSGSCPCRTGTVTGGVGVVMPATVSRTATCAGIHGSAAPTAELRLHHAGRGPDASGSPGSPGAQPQTAQCQGSGHGHGWSGLTDRLSAGQPMGGPPQAARCGHKPRRTR